MFNLPIWDKEQHPDIAMKPLKGETIDLLIKMLDFQTRAVKDTVRVSEALLGEDIEKLRAKNVFNENELRAIVEAQKELFRQNIRTVEVINAGIKEALQNPTIKKVGIDLDGIRVIASQFAANPKTDFDHIRQELGQARERFKESMLEGSDAIQAAKESAADLQDAVQNSTSYVVMGLASAALAVQEGREKQFMDLAEKHMREILSPVQESFASSASVDKNQAQEDGLSRIGAMFFLQLQFLQKLKQDKSAASFLPFAEAAVLGSRYYETGRVGGVIGDLRKIIALAKDIDAKTEKGKIEIERIEKGIIKKLSDTMNVDPVYAPDRLSGMSKGTSR
ncbi:MAG: hypothetical protein SFW63_03405 [Alphaproteobacteria bacterium]|nr:hypothetical protein [Alphaproteobacteria bacterium]